MEAVRGGLELTGKLPSSAAAKLAAPRPTKSRLTLAPLRPGKDRLTVAVCIMTIRAISTDVFNSAWISSELKVLSYQLNPNFGTGKVK